MKKTHVTGDSEEEPLRHRVEELLSHEQKIIDYHSSDKGTIKLIHELEVDKVELTALIEERTGELRRLNKSLEEELSKRRRAENKLRKSLNNYKTLSAYLQKVREEERKGIARVIHDDLSQLLITLKIELCSLKGNTDKLDFIAHDSIDTQLLLVEQCINAVTSIITKLRPIVLDKLGLTPALKKLFTDFQKDTGITCDVLIREDSSNIKGELATAIYRVVQEGLNNIRIHSKASYVTVVISGNHSVFHVTLTDFGIGASEEALSSPTSFGIIGMKERMEEIKGTINIKGVQGSGTTINIKVPIKK